MISPWLTANEAAEYARRSRRTIDKWIEKRLIVPSYPDRGPLIHVDDLDRFLRSRKKGRRVEA